ncbi:L,D-transpeptidase [Clostridium sp. C8-1-8]|uniref:L,D-transpeptidase n=1 Tax=Clostridium sp. C8-1-8 TaxID=2698831 RepID=UPI00136B2170|nr:L,D-transpeptidase [Clostridium sp. C8-1-8]
MLWKKVIIMGTLAACIITGSLFYYGKSVQAKKDKDEFNTLKEKYINEQIDYKTLNSGISALEKSGYKADDSEKKSLETIEEQRDELKKIDEKFAGKNYNMVLSSVTNLENKAADNSIKVKIKELKVAINDAISDDINQDISDQKFQDGLNILDQNKQYLEQNFLVANKKLIEDAKNKKQQEEDNRKKAEEDVKKQLGPAVAAYLDGYTPSPAKESVVSGYSSRSSFLVWVDLTNQKTNVFVGSKGNWKLIREIDCSTGAPGSDTPKGIYKVSGRGDWFYNASIKEGAKNWVQFFGNYLFHSFPMDKNKNVTDYTLGKPVSHGCVRLSLENSKWIFDNIPNGTTVYIN